MDERIDTALKETVTSRRLIAKGAAAGGLATLFAAVATGRVLADDSPDSIDDLDDSPDTSPDIDDSPDTSPDDGETTNGNSVRARSGKRGRGRRRGRSRSRKNGRR